MSVSLTARHIYKSNSKLASSRPSSWLVYNKLSPNIFCGVQHRSCSSNTTQFIENLRQYVKSNDKTAITTNLSELWSLNNPQMVEKAHKIKPSKMLASMTFVDPINMDIALAMDIINCLHKDNPQEKYMGLLYLVDQCLAKQKGEYLKDCVREIAKIGYTLDPQTAEQCITYANQEGDTQLMKLIFRLHPITPQMIILTCEPLVLLRSTKTLSTLVSHFLTRDPLPSCHEVYSLTLQLNKARIRRHLASQTYSAAEKTGWQIIQSQIRHYYETMLEVEHLPRREEASLEGIQNYLEFQSLWDDETEDVMEILIQRIDETGSAGTRFGSSPCFPFLAEERVIQIMKQTFGADEDDEDDHDTDEDGNGEDAEEIKFEVHDITAQLANMRKVPIPPLYRADLFGDDLRHEDSFAEAAALCIGDVWLDYDDFQCDDMDLDEDDEDDDEEDEDDEEEDEQDDDEVDGDTAAEAVSVDFGIDLNGKDVRTARQEVEKMLEMLLPTSVVESLANNEGFVSTLAYDQARQRLPVNDISASLVQGHPIDSGSNKKLQLEYRQSIFDGHSESSYVQDCYCDESVQAMATDADEDSDATSPAAVPPEEPLQSLI